MIDLQDAPVIAPITASQWRNRYFLKAGESHWGFDTFPSEESARRAADEHIRSPFRGSGAYSPDGAVWWWSDFSHHMQIPFL